MKASNYIGTLFEIINKAVITDEFGTRLGLNEGTYKIIELIKLQTALGKKIIFIGNGGSASIASHGALDFWKNGGLRAVSFNEGALLTCIGNDYGYSHVFEKPIEMFADEGDVLIAISSSGKSENILKGVKAAKELKCGVITLSGFSEENPLREMGDINIYVPSGEYGFVELSHQIAIHMIVDIIMKEKLVV
ncbi:MAG: D-sedoheptulose-7-phosphate isomerase [Bacillota bacterium]